MDGAELESAVPDKGGTMKKLLFISVLVALVIGLAALGTAAVAINAVAKPDQPKTLSVNGEGKVDVTPDIALANVGVETRDPDVSKAVDDNIKMTGAVVTAIKARNVQEADIHTSNFSVYWQEVYDSQGQPTGQGRYIVNNTVTITVREIPKLGEILGDALGAGANTVGGVSFTLEDTTQALKDVRTKAITDARVRAEEIAQGLGVKVGKVLSVNEYGASVPVYADKGYAAGVGGGGGAVPVSPGTYEITMSISVVFEIE
jgi:uncharacterized protein YggE